MTSPEFSPLESYILAHEDRVWLYQDIFKIEPDQLDRLMVDLHMGIEEKISLAAVYPKTVSFIFCDHPTQRDSKLLQLQQSLAEEDFPIVVDYEALHRLFEITLYAYAAYGLGVGSPVTKEEVSRFKEQRLAESTEIPIEIQIEGKNKQIILACVVNPIEFGRQTFYERRWYIKSTALPVC